MSNFLFLNRTQAQQINLSSSSQQTGSSILEVLIALIILSFGLLGAAGMQATAMQANKETRSQSVAASLARELADKMRGNHAIAIKPDAANNPYLINETLTGTAAFAASNENCFTTACSTPAAVAAWDMDDWRNRVRNALPDPRIRICFDKTPFDADGKPQWNCTSTGDVAVLKMAWTNTGTDGVLKFSSGNMRPLIILPLTAGTIN